MELGKTRTPNFGFHPETGRFRHAKAASLTSKFPPTPLSLSFFKLSFHLLIGIFVRLLGGEGKFTAFRPHRSQWTCSAWNVTA